MQILVFDIGGTSVKWSIRRKDGSICRKGSFPTPKDTAEHLVSSLMDIRTEAGSSISGIAISAPGVIEHGRSMRTGGALLYAYGFPLADRLEELAQLPVTVGNDGKCAARAELEQGALRGVRTGAVLIAGTGLGGGLIVDGDVLTGPHGSAGELSCLASGFEPDGTLRSAAGMDASTTGLLRIMREECGVGEEELPDGFAAFRLLSEGNAGAERAFAAWCTNFASVIFDLAVMLDIERCAVGGGISEDPCVLEGIKAALSRIASKMPEIFAQTITLPDVVRCRFGAEANQIGALSLFLETQHRR
jgi:predicted NBD/HSP70 family sugar kinase